MPGLSIRLSRSVRDRISCSTSSGRAPSGSTKVSDTCRSSAVSSACQNCKGGAPPWKTSSRYRPPAIRAPGTRCTSSPDDSAARSRGASNGIDPRAGSAGEIAVALVGWGWSRAIRASGRPECQAGSRRQTAAVGRRLTPSRTQGRMRRSPRGGRSPPVLSLAGRRLLDPEACAGSDPGPH